MRINFSILYLMPVFVITDLAAESEDESAGKDRLTSSVRRLLWKPQHYRRMQTKHSRRMPPLELQSHSQSYETYKSRKPNIILILTDDQDVELGSLNFMPETTRLLKEGGAEFRHAYTTTPMCCPSRSSILTGLYVHNHNVYTNNDNCSNAQWQMEHETKSFAAYLSNAGYHTGYFGKYLNKYNGSYTPPGWKEWGGLIMNSKYYNYSINLNGKRIRHGDDYYKDYYTDLVANDSINFLRQWKTWNSNKPSLLVMSFPAPHGPEDSAPQYSNMFLNVTSHHTPSYDYAPNPDKQWILQVTGPMMPIHKQFTNVLMTKRLQTLQSVDNAVKRVYEQLKELGELENTFIIYTSDHGYHLGQFGLVKGKSFPFEFDVRVPFLVRGPGIEPGSIVNEVALNIDLAPTLLDIAGLSVPAHMDGRSLMKLFHKRKKNGRKYLINWPDTFLIESSGRREMSFPNMNSLLSNKIPITPLESENTSNSALTNTDESSSLLSFSFPAPTTESTDNFAGESQGYKSSRNDAKEDSSRETEWVNSDLISVAPASKAERLSLECQQPEYASPCKPKQKWHCVLKDNRWRKHKCRFPAVRTTTSLPNLQKCTCITEDGIVYMRFQTTADGELTMSNQAGYRKIESANPTVVHYFKPNKSSDELVNELANSWRIMKRQRRNTIDMVNRISTNSQTVAILDVVDGQMIELPTLGNESNSAACMVSFNGSVRCSLEIYENLALWKISQLSISQQIRKLQSQIKQLKEIQRHLDSIHPQITNLEKYNNSISQARDESISRSPIDEPHSESGESNILAPADSVTSTSRRHRHHHSNVPDNSTKNPVRDSSEDGKQNSIPDTCYCVPHESDELPTSEEVLKEQKRRVKEQRMKKKERKLRKRAKLGKVCFLEKMNCFNHDNDHWRTPPYWNEGPFCFCMNANNNTYNCIRTINATHNFLYCEFVTGLVTFYNLRIDPFQQWNRYDALSKQEKSWLKATLSQMVKCKGHQECGSHVTARNTSNPDVQNYQKKYSISDRKGQRKNVTRYHAA